MTYPKSFCSNGHTHKNSWPNPDTPKNSNIQTLTSKNSPSPCLFVLEFYGPVNNEVEPVS